MSVVAVVMASPVRRSDVPGVPGRQRSRHVQECWGLVGVVGRPGTIVLMPAVAPLVGCDPTGHPRPTCSPVRAVGQAMLGGCKERRVMHSMG